MEIIVSADNKTVKRIGKLKQKKYRDETGEYFAEGYKNVFDTFSARPELVRSIVMSESAFRSDGSEFSPFSPTVLSDRLYEKITETESARGVLAIVRKDELSFPEKNRCVLLDRVRDPGNVGTIIRTAVACGYDVVLNDCADVYSPKVVRSAMSAIVNCGISSEIPCARLKSSGYEIIVADMKGDNIFEAEKPDKYCVVIGNEGDGVCGEILACADRLLSIPQENIESLNAAVAAGIMMFGLRYAAK